MTDQNPKTEEEIDSIFASIDPAYEKRRDAETETDIRSLALEYVVGLYQANATKNANPSKSFVDMDKGVSDLVADARYIVDYLKGNIE